MNIQNKNHLTPLHLASFFGWVKMVRILLDRGASANSEDNLGRTPLHLVAEGSGDLGQDGVRVASLLLEHGADINAQGKDSAIPLHLASYYGGVDMVQMLLDHGATANSKGNLGRTSLHLVAGSKHYPLDDVRVTLLLLEHHVDVNVQDEDNSTPLHVASYYGRVDMVDVLLRHGATANLEDNLGRTPLRFVAGSRYCPEDNGVPIGRLLLWYGADVDAQDKANITPLQAATCLRRVDMVRMLLYCGANANLEVSMGWTMLHLVASGQCIFGLSAFRIAELLLEHGADVDVQDRENTTPLHLASYLGSVEFSQLLLDHGASPNAQRKSGRTPLHLVAEGKEYGDARITDLLLEHGADVNARDTKNMTPLHLASYCGNTEITQMLLDHDAITKLDDNRRRTPMHPVAECLRSSGYDDIDVAQLLQEHGTDVNSQDKRNTTPLHLASSCWKVEIAQVLLDRGANPSAKNVVGLTPLHMAAQGAYHSKEDGVEVVQLLLEHGADVNAQDENHATPLDLALYHRRTEIASLLLHCGDKGNTKSDQGPTPDQLGIEEVQFHDENRPGKHI